jgi:D-galactarolactone cycloisomerase
VKVGSLEAYPLKIRAREKLQGGTFGYTHYQTVLVKAVCDGVEGWGEAMTRADPEATALLVRYLGKPLVGAELENVSDAWEQCWRGLRVRGHTRGVDVEALSGIEIALYDCQGMILRKPLRNLFSSKPAERVAVFAGSLFASRGPLEDQVEHAKRRGLSGAKVKIGFGVGRDRRILASVRRLWPEGMLVADANGAYDAAVAAKACAAFRDLDLAWFEEPVLSDDIGGYASLRGLGVRIGAGESWFPGDFEVPIARKLVDVVEPSVSRCGGIGVEMEVARRASRAGLRFSPMTGMNSAVSVAASIQVAAARPSVGVEYNPFPNPIQTELATGLDEPKGGKVRAPTGNGLGITVDARFVRSHSA